MSYIEPEGLRCNFAWGPCERGYLKNAGLESLNVGPPTYGVCRISGKGNNRRPVESWDIFSAS